MALDYTSLTAVKAYGNVTTTGDDTLLGELITGYSRQVDRHCGQAFSQETYTAETLRAVIDRDGVLTCYPAVPTMQAPTAASWRGGPTVAWTAITVGDLDIDAARSGCTVRLLGHDLGAYRGQRLQARLTYVGGYADLAALPDDLELAARRLVWWSYKLREAPIGKTAMPAMGQITIPPSSWPKDVREVLAPYVRVVPL